MGAGTNAAATDEASASGSAARRIDWRPCPADPTADCGKLTLPIDWA
ncbi:hypothetical protein GTZ85_15780, partial [Streptomyces sp. SID5474]|nr:hypothetical protein [Streptomyces sp. SID5474]